MQFLSGAVTGLGYKNHQERSKRYGTNGSLGPDPRETPSQTNMYASDYWTTVREDERKRGMTQWNQAQNPWETGVSPKPAYASMFAAPNLENGQQGGTAGSRIQTLAGEEVSVESFTHNNMQPYFRGSVRQNVKPDANSPMLEKFTGRTDLIPRKQEVECFFEPTAGYGNVCGMENKTDYYRNHIVEPNARNNDFPIQQIHVGPGLGQGFTATPAGGFQQASTLDYIRPKTVDELRVLSKPKCTYEIPVQGPAKGTSQRGMTQTMDKNRPDTYYEQTPDMWLRTTGAVTKEMGRPVVDLKPTSRVDTHREYQGAAKSVQPGRGESDDYGRSSVMVYDNERMITQTRTVVSNLTSTVKAIIAPFLDILRPTNKAYTLDAARQFGSLQAQMPSKPTLYDPSNPAKTTVKETTLYDASDAGVMTPQMPSKPTTYDPSNPAKTTVKETTLYDASDAGVLSPQMPSKATVYDPVNHVMRTTIKETTLHDNDVMNLKGPEAGTVHNLDMAKKTVRETLPLEDTTRNVAATTYKVSVYYPDAAKKTVKETVVGLGGSKYGFIGGSVTTERGAYAHIDVQVPNTQKQFISDYEYTGTAQSRGEFRPRDRDAEEHAEIDGTREMLNIAAGHTPNAGGALGTEGLDASAVGMNFKNPMSDSLAARTVGNVTRVYQPTAMNIESCEVTRPTVPLNANENRLDPGLLSALKTNPYNLTVNPLQ